MVSNLDVASRRVVMVLSLCYGDFIHGRLGNAPYAEIFTL